MFSLTIEYGAACCFDAGRCSNQGFLDAGCWCVYVCMYLSICLSISLSLSLCLFVCLSLFLSECECVCIRIHAYNTYEQHTYNTKRAQHAHLQLHTPISYTFTHISLTLSHTYILYITYTFMHLYPTHYLHLHAYITYTFTHIHAVHHLHLHAYISNTLLTPSRIYHLHFHTYTMEIVPIKALSLSLSLSLSCCTSDLAEELSECQTKLAKSDKLALQHQRRYRRSQQQASFLSPLNSQREHIL